MRTRRPIRRARHWITFLTVPLIVVTFGIVGGARPAAAASYVPISGAGSTWSYNAIHAWQGNVTSSRMQVDYAAVGSTTGRANFKQGTADWAASDIPYGVKDGTSDDPPPTSRGFAYMPVTAGGTVFMYNLKIGTNRVTNLRLSGANVAAIFTGTITRWNDPAIAADNPGLTLPALKVVPVVRSDGSGSTSQFTQWMVATQRSAWLAFCARVGRSPCTQTSAYPTVPGIVGQTGDLGVAGYVSQPQAAGAIGYVEYSYAIQAGFPVAKVLNTAGFYTEPTSGHVAVALLKAKINQDSSNKATYLTQDLSDVYVNPDPRTYPLSSYSYMILPTTPDFGFNAQKGFTLGDFGKYVLCRGQQVVNSLGYSALPINLVEAGYAQLAKVPGANVPVATTDIIRSCNNPTFSTDGTNTLARNDPYPASCDHKGPTQCSTGTGGATGSTPVKPGAQGGGGSNAGSGASPGATPGASGSASPGSSAAPNSTAPACDPDTTGCTAGAIVADGRPVDGVPVLTATNFSDSLEVALMVAAALLLVGLGLGPPIISQINQGRRLRRDRRDGLA